MVQRAIDVADAVDRHRFNKFRARRPADRVEDDTGAPPSGNFVDRFHQILFFGRDNILGALINELLSLRIRASERDRLSTDRISDLDCGKSYATRGAWNAHGVF